MRGRYGEGDEADVHPVDHVGNHKCNFCRQVSCLFWSHFSSPLRIGHTRLPLPVWLKQGLCALSEKPTVRCREEVGKITSGGERENSIVENITRYILV